MNPLAAGGFAPVGQVPEIMPGGPPRRPMGFSHRNIGPGGSMGGIGGIGAPGNRIPTSGLDLTMNLPMPTPSKGGTPSNELVVTSWVCNKWPGKGYEKYYYPGTLMFSQRTHQPTRRTVDALSLAQLNELLREGRNILDSQLTKTPKSSFTKDGKPTDSSELVGVKAEFVKYLKHGEDYLVGHPTLCHDILSNRLFTKLTCLSLAHLVETFRLGGLYTSGENMKKPIVNINIGLQGPSAPFPVDNIWGTLYQGDRVWLILKAIPNSNWVAGSTEPEFKYFQFIPRIGYGYPSPHELFYRDPSGKACFGIGYYIGEVLYDPIRDVEPHMCKKMAGLTVSSREAYEFQKMNTGKVVLHLGSSKAQLSEHAN